MNYSVIIILCKHRKMRISLNQAFNASINRNIDLSRNHCIFSNSDFLQ